MVKMRFLREKCEVKYVGYSRRLSHGSYLIHDKLTWSGMSHSQSNINLRNSYINNPWSEGSHMRFFTDPRHIDILTNNMDKKALQDYFIVPIFFLPVRL